MNCANPKRENLPRVEGGTGEWMMMKKKWKAAVDRNHDHLLGIHAAPPDHPCAADSPKLIRLLPTD